MADLPPLASPFWVARRRHGPPLDGDVDAQVVIVGGGVVGATTAVLLARAGVRVVVLEAGAIGQGTTGASTAKVTALQGTRLSAVRRAHGPEAAARYAEAQLAGQGWMTTRAEERGADVALERRDAVTYTVDPDQIAAVDEEAAASREAGLPVVVTDQVPELSFPTRRAVRLADQVQLDPRAWVEDLAVELDQSAEAVVYEGTRVAAVSARGHGVTTDQGHRVHADHVVVATLLPITDRGAFFARASPTMSHGVALALDGPIDTSFPMAYGVGPPTRSLRTASTPEGAPVLLVGGGSGHVVGRRRSTLDEPRELVSWARQHFPVGRVLQRWSAHDLHPVDELPFAGRADRLPGAPWVATGFAKWGLTNGTAAAMTIAAGILGGQSQPWDDVFDPRRGLSRGGAARMVGLNASAGRELAWGWARTDAATTDDGPEISRRAGVPCGAVAPPPDRRGCDVSLVCTHLGGIVRWNEAAGTWDCPLHGSRFEADGAVVAGPATSPLRRLGPEPSPVEEPPGGSR